MDKIFCVSRLWRLVLFACLVLKKRVEFNEKVANLFLSWYIVISTVYLELFCLREHNLKFRFLPFCNVGWLLVINMIASHDIDLHCVYPGGFKWGPSGGAAAVRSHQRGPGAGGAISSSVCDKGGEQGSGGARGETRPPQELPAVHPAGPPHAGGAGWCQRRQTHSGPGFHYGVYAVRRQTCLLI